MRNLIQPAMIVCLIFVLVSDSNGQTEQSQKAERGNQEKQADGKNEAGAQDDPLMPKPPEGFVIQKLDPIGGRIFKPAKWKFSSELRGKTLVYKLFEPVEGSAGFDNGVTINLVLNIEEVSKIKPSAYAEKYLEAMRRTGKNVENLKKEKYNKTWVRNGVIVTQNKKLTGVPKDYRIRYETHADDDKGLLIVVISGSTADKFEHYHKIFRTIIKGFVLADMKRSKLGKQKKQD